MKHNEVTNSLKALIFVAVILFIIAALFHSRTFLIIGVLLTIGIILNIIEIAKYQKALNAIRPIRSQLEESILCNFMVQSCSRCLESSMTLINFSPNARSIQYQCNSCGKKMYAAAGTPNSTATISAYAMFNNMVDQYRNSGLKELSNTVTFNTPMAPLPYEQTTRTPIPEAVRNEVWRRDQGRCVICNSNANLQFDHIIPVAKGGATTVKNLQLLCQQCNATKGAKI